MDTKQETGLLYCCQCTDKASGVVGAFMYHQSSPFLALSPVFSSLQYLFEWMKENGYDTAHAASWKVIQSEAS